MFTKVSRGGYQVRNCARGTMVEALKGNLCKLNLVQDCHKVLSRAISFCKLQLSQIQFDYLFPFLLRLPLPIVPLQRVDLLVLPQKLIVDLETYPHLLEPSEPCFPHLTLYRSHCDFVSCYFISCLISDAYIFYVSSSFLIPSYLCFSAFLISQYSALTTRLVWHHSKI